MADVIVSVMSFSLRGTFSDFTRFSKRVHREDLWDKHRDLPAVLPTHSRISDQALSHCPNQRTAVSYQQANYINLKVDLLRMQSHLHR